MKEKLSQFGNKKLTWFAFFLILIIISLTVFLVRQTQNFRGIAAPADKLELEGGVLSGAVSKLSDSLASGGQYVLFASQTSTPTPTPSSQGGYGPRSAPPTPTGTNVYTIPSNIDGTGSSDVSTALQNFVNSIPNGTSSTPSIIVFPAGKNYQLNPAITLSDRNNLTFWGYGATLRTTGPGNTVNSSAFLLYRSDNIKILGFRIRGNHTDMSTLSDGEFAMGVAMYDDSDNVEVADNYISDVFGDGIFVFVFEKPACDNWNFHHNLIENIGRQGITPNEGSGRIEYNIIRGPGMYNIDAEDQHSSYPSNGGNKNLGPVVISNNWFDGWEQYDNYTPHVVVADYDSTSMETIHDITIENNLFTGGDLGMLSQYFGNDIGLISFWGSVPKTNVIIRNNTFNLPSDQRSGWAIRLNNVSGGVISGNVIPGMTVQCNSCTNVTIQNNQ
ncbi:MAG: hypothetical protein A3A51_04400 [Candidatus Levybacteria bacterium RIFCSPLOWO2_01_FULL_39_10]|nr:MAG: hypothetical protein A3A51_04400 [Candidatus Levybacteria bacterium RIFCSPLOWO2_01_FULL_39_10]